MDWVSWRALRWRIVGEIDNTWKWNEGTFLRAEFDQALYELKQNLLVADNITT